MHSPLVSWSRMVYLVGIVLLLAFLVPTAWFPFQLGKVAVFAPVLLVAAIMFVAGRGAHDLMRAHGLKLALFSLLLPLSYLVSWFFSIDKAASLTGFGIEVDTVIFTTIAAVAFLLAFVFFRTLRTVRMLSNTVLWTLVGIVILQWLVILFGQSVIPFEIFADRSVNILGKWNDLGLALALLTILLLVRVELTSFPMLKRGAIIAGLVATTLLLGFINFSLAWWLILAGSVVLGLIAFLTERSESAAERDTNPYASSSWINKVPWYSSVGILVSITFLLFGAQINTELTNRFPVSSLEVRPSYESTLEVIGKARGGSLERTLIGTGPNTFSTSWIDQKPAEVNQSAFWNLDFNVGFSTVLTALGTVGLVGALMWFVPILLVLAGLIRVVRLSLLNREERVAALMVGIGSLVLLLGLVFYVPSPSVTLLGFVLAGAAFGFLWRQGRQNANEEYISSSGVLLGWAVPVALVVLALLGTWVADRRLVAQARTNLGSVALQTGNADLAFAEAQSARSVEETGDNLRLAINADVLKIQQLANSETASTQATQDQFKSIVERAIANGQVLVTKYPSDYRSHITVGRVYDLLAGLQVQGAYDSALASYQAALKENASSPEIALMLARLTASQNNLELTQQYLSQSLTLKPNYTDAILFVVQLNVANNDLTNAILAAQAAAQSAPGVAPIWFQLGLLYYSGGYTKDSIPALERALSIVPDYANAKYFLGLSYYVEGRTPDAIKQFEELRASNPESAEVGLILDNLRQGKQPFDSAQPPVTDTPEDRPTAPISE